MTFELLGNSEATKTQWELSAHVCVMVGTYGGFENGGLSVALMGIEVRVDGLRARIRVCQLPPGPRGLTFAPELRAVSAEDTWGRGTVEDSCPVLLLYITCSSWLQGLWGQRTSNLDVSDKAL